MFWGIFDDTQGLSPSFYTNLGKSPSTIMMFMDFGNFPLDFCKNADQLGSMPYVTWEPRVDITKILTGQYDSYLQKFGQDIAKFGKPFLLRFGHEFNGDWYPWSVYEGKLVPASTYVQVYKYVHDKVVAAGGSKAIWVWCANAGNGGANPQDILSYYPGDKYVNWIGMDGYNWGTSAPGFSWKSFSGVFNSLYQQLTTNYPTKPIMIGEMGCSSTGGDKVAWINDMFTRLPIDFPKVRSFTWFNINKETDWRFNVNQGSTDAFKAGIAKNFVQYDPALGNLGR